MANQYYDVRVDVSKSEVIDSGLRFTQGDSTVVFLRIAVMNGDTKFDASNTTPSVNFVKPDGTYVTGTPVASNDVWVYQFLGNELQAAGRVLCDIKFTYSSGRISSSKFAFFVEKDTTITGAAASGSYVLPMEEALAEMNNYKQQGKTMAEAAEASALDSEAWAVGQRSGSDVPATDPTYENNSKYYADQARIYEESAAAIVGIGIATTSTAGIVKPDGTTITVAQDGTISSAGGGGAVDSVNGQTGVVVLDASDVGALPDNTPIPAEQIQSDWNQSDNTKKDFIKNKPQIPAAQIQSDWNQTNTSAKDYIKNKPSVLGHDMIPVSGDISTIAALNNGNDNYVINAYSAKRWSNCDAIQILTAVSADDDGVGVWEDDATWESGSRTGWITHTALHGILSDDDVEIEPVFKITGGDAVGLFAMRIDDAVTASTGGVALKFTAPITASGYVGIKLKHLRTNTEIV